VIEEWRWVVGYEGLYKISNAGRVMSFNGRGRRSAPHILKVTPARNGNGHVTLSRGGYYKRPSVLALVATAGFGGERLMRIQGNLTERLPRFISP
jgi:hypothetical protein